MSTIVNTPKPPYYAVIFSSLRGNDIDGYEETAARMVELAAQQPGFLGVESVREVLGITVSYWSDLDSIRRWKSNAEHQVAQKMGMDKWYSSYKTRIARVERDYGNAI
ncbi:MAG: antibiotic biosynthesis monooxygenase [Gammaproteobacteria bacterium]|nr:antibiotic biosynthesis monooxygenase [Gammaproteobacteria bacterium]